MRHLGVWILTAVLFAVIGGWCVWLFMHGAEAGKGEEEATSQPAVTAPAPVSHDEAGNVVVRFDDESQKRVGIQVQPLAAVQHQPELCAYGVLQEKPSHTFTLRAPLAGKVLPPPGRDWPALGSDWPADSVIGAIEPRLSPTERADLAARLADAQGNVEEVRALLSASLRSLESKRQLNVGQKVVSDQVLAEAEAAVKGHEAHLEASLATVKILSQSLAAATQPAAALPLAVPIKGRIVESPAGPNESVESGQPLLRIANYDHMMARVALPAGVKLDDKVDTARIAITGHEDRWFVGQFIALAPTADGVTAGPTYLFELAPAGLPVQPGMTVVAYLQLPGEPRQGVIVPRGAVIRYLGKSWIYAQSGPEQFARRELVAGVPLADGWFAAQGFKPGEPIVTVGAQNLLAEELRWQTTGTEEEE